MCQLLAPVKAILDALAPHQVRAVGGAVRAWLRHDPTTGLDLDLATTATPDEIEKLLHAAGIVTSDAGKRWGTITAHLDGHAYEITSLRQDAYTPGSRYPTVTFGTDWETDAHRRDFTINAIYMDEDENLFDPFDGATDLKNGIVRFIGQPEVRLSEDPLRLYRFWRFCGTYGVGGITPELITACQQAVPGLISASRSRRITEWNKLLETPQAATVLAELQRHELLAAMNPEV
ncbi:MAG: CCA tRNA nucleotidyltransferase [Alphaproteobacteria bacterium]|nr:MAG: CCA tRNA nucleotidyltransferase [Alphaproteobacteria bacterium]